MHLRFLSCLLIGSSAFAAVERSLDDLRVIETTISRQGLTRITVKEDRIQNVFGVAGEYVLEADESQGQVFIRPIGPGISKPISITLTTEGGYTQDLRLVPHEQSPEALILKPPVDLRHEIRREKQNQAPLTRSEIEGLLQACQEGEIPLEYKAVPLGLNTLKGPYLLVREIKGEKLRGLTYEVVNSSKAPLLLHEEDFALKCGLKSNDIIAILMPKKTLNPGERTHVYVASRTVQ